MIDTVRRALVTVIAAASVPLLSFQAAYAIPQGTKVQTYKSGLNFPVDMAWVKGTKKIFFTEKSGAIRVMIGRRLLSRPCRNLDVNSSGERGALGIALHPNFKKNKFLYVFYTKRSPLQHRVTRFKVNSNRCRNAKHIIRGLNASSSGYHNGGQLEFRRGKLFVTTGEAHSPSFAQDTGSRQGKVLRLNPNGSIPKGNPFGNNNPVWAYGLRNPFGLTVRGANNRLYVTENGPSCDDELNLIKKGRNYGWGPNYRCGTRGVGPNPKGPMRRWSSIIVPTDPWWYMGNVKPLRRRLFVGDFNGGLHRLRLNRKGTKVKADKIIHTAPSGIVDVSNGPRGRLYFMTPNAIYRIVP
ncbi:MAG TPA: PQQ-dependent sugar dehydrogenase, partial [Actinomycetota bacterium]|nr:PQQ-dependent sugar dehydrogenase [Actinomycetota bacterium]